MLAVEKISGTVKCDACSKEVSLERAKVTGSRWLRIMSFSKEPRRLIARTSLLDRDFCGDQCLMDFVGNLKGNSNVVVPENLIKED